MSTTESLHAFLEKSASGLPERIAVEEADGGAISYGELARLCDRLRDWLHGAGVRAGDRVGIYLRKSIDSVAQSSGFLRAVLRMFPWIQPLRPPAMLSSCMIAS